MANQESFRGVGDRFGIERDQLQRIFISFCETILEIRGEYIKWPSKEGAIVNIQEFEERWSFPHTVGAIDCTEVPIKPPNQNRDSYINRKGVASMKTQAVCDHKLRFMDVYSGWVGSVHDARMFRNSPLALHLARPDVLPPNAHIIGDGAYPLQISLMTPFRDNGHLSDLQKKYNRIHSSARTVIERSFALLKSKWRRLKYLDMDLMDKVPNVIVTACVLHNLIIDLEQVEENDTVADMDNEEGQHAVLDDVRNAAAAVKRQRIANML
ncbi:putative nuclease HARBI1 [Haliotis rubra]|uniref:putative nuclease HARBI1 n=1 Tax=Haliotis rubra TaxID=36100 RepID=UPI001EE532D1|nr:putative nuclease HARBI1 [Haliotis rubra]